MIKRYLSIHLKWVLLTLLCIFLFSTSKVVAALVSTYVLNSLVQGNLQKFIFYTGLEFFCWGIFAIFTYLMFKVRGITVQKMSVSLREEISHHISDQSYEDFHQKDTGDYASWLSNDVTTIEENGFKGFFSLATIIFDSLISSLTLITFNWSLILVILMLSAISIYVPQLLQNKLRQENITISKANEHFLSVVNDLLRGFNTLFSFNLTQRIDDAVKKEANIIKKQKVAYAKTSGASTAIAVMCNLLGQTGTQCWTGILVIYKFFPIGSIFATGTLSSNIFNDLAQLGPTINDLKSIMPLFSKYQLKSSERNAGKHTKIIRPEIRISNLAYTYPNTPMPTLKKLHVVIPFNSKVIVSGESGCGKSTLLNILAGKLLNYQGSIKLNETELHELAPYFLKETIVYLDQTPHIFTGTIRDNLTLGQPYSDQALHTALNQSDLSDFVQRQSEGLETPVGEGGQLFSGGQRQRLALARGLLRHPQILLIDEGTNSLSRQSAIKIEKLLVKLTDLTVIFVTHQIHEEVAPLFTQTIVLSDSDKMPSSVEKRNR